jgi:hypothetical protein
LEKQGDLDPGRSSPDDMETILRMDVEIAAQEHLLAMAEFWKLYSEPACATPQRVEEAARKQKIASQRLEWSLKRFEEFIRTGKAPEDL